MTPPQLYENTIIAWMNESGQMSSVERVLWISPDNMFVAVIDISNLEHLPEIRLCETIQQALQCGMVRKLEQDPYARFMMPVEMYPKGYIDRRNAAWSIIADIVEQEPAIYDRELRGTLIKQACEVSKQDKKAVYRLLKRYWVRGKVMNALIPDFTRCGGSGKDKVSKSGAKLGRPRKVARADPNLAGVNVTQQDKINIALYTRLYWANQKQYTLEEVFQRLLEDKYAIGVKFVDGNPVPVLPPLETVISFVQFKYHAEKSLSNISQTLQRRIGKIPYALTKRPLLGNSTDRSFGPGSYFEIDATLTNSFLVSRFDRSRIIGRLVLYIVKDVFSRLVAGFYAGLEGPSWVGAMIALENATADKVQFCREHGIEIEEEDWPCHYLPASITGDRGEMESNHANNLISSLNVRVDNTPPYRGDMKPFVESHFGKIKGRIDSFIPGLVQEEIRERGEPDYRLGARLTSEELNRIFIYHILEHNKTEISNYPLTKEMTEDHVPPIPAELWAWGVSRGLASLHEKPKNVVKLNLMPRGKASVTRQGIYFSETKMHYDAPGLLEKGWYDRAVRDGRYSVTISHDPRNSNLIYIPTADGTEFTKCSMLGKHERFSGCRTEEVQDQLFLEEVESSRRATGQRQLKADTNAQMRATVAEGTPKTEAAINPFESKASRLQNIRSNRQAEKEALRDEQSWKLHDAQDSLVNLTDEGMADTQETIEGNAEPETPSPILDLLRKRQRRRLS